MPSKSKASTKSTEYVYFVYGGIMKEGNTFFGAFSGDDIDEQLETYKEWYGGNCKARYVKSEDSEGDLEKIKKKLSSKLYAGTDSIYETIISDAVKTMRDEAGVKNASTWNVRNSDEPESKTKAPKKSKKTEPETDDDEEDEDDKVVVKKSSKGKTKETKKNKSSDDEDEEDEEEEEKTAKSKGKTTKSNKKTKAIEEEEEDDDAEESGEEESNGEESDEEEKVVVKKKTTGKGGKSKKSSK